MKKQYDVRTSTVLVPCRYAAWTPEECQSRECLKVFARAGLIADVSALRGILVDKLPQVLAGRSLTELSEPWPEVN